MSAVIRRCRLEACFCWSAALRRPSHLLFEMEARRRCARTRVSRTTLDATATGVSEPDDVWIISDVVLKAQPQRFYSLIYVSLISLRLSFFLSFLLKAQVRERRGGGMERPVAEHLRPDEGGQLAAVLPAHPGKMPTSVCGPETATTTASASTVSGPEPLQTPGTQQSS